MYKVLMDFVDTDGVAYEKGDTYPFFNFLLDEKHAEYLMSKKNKQKKPLIEKINKEVIDDESEITGDS